MHQTHNLLTATILSFLVIIGWNFIFGKPLNKPLNDQEKQVKEKVYRTYPTTLSDRIAFENARMIGSVNLQGLLLDDLKLKNYLSDDETELFRLLSPQMTKGAYFISNGWDVGDGSKKIKLPDRSTKWKHDGTAITPDHPVTFSWENDYGLLFKVTISIDNEYMFTLTRTVENHSQHDVSIGPHLSIVKQLIDIPKNTLIMHEGPVGIPKDKLLELKYSKIAKNNYKFLVEEDSKNLAKWFGFSEKYWLVCQISNMLNDGKIYFSHTTTTNNDDLYKVTTFSPRKVISGGNFITDEIKLFAGAKELSSLEKYAKSEKIKFFDRALDFGILYLITKPIYRLLQVFFQFTGNFGVAIILLTLFMRILMIPLSIKSGISMLKIKELQPEITKLKKLYENDKVGLNKASVELFKKHKVTPMSGCLPTLMQVPVFFALYKVIYITIEMRQAPFFLWITDLSVADPTNIMTLFGLLDWNCPQFLHIGILPLILGLTMVLQQKLTPSHYDDGSQAFMVKSMPYLFVLLFANFPSGLVLYWVFNNIVSVLQQFAIGKYLLFRASKIKGT